MGGKGGGDPGFYNQPADTSGYGTPDEAAATLAAQAPLDLSGYQQSIDVNKAATGATAPATTSGTTGDGSSPSDTPATSLASSVLKPPDYWNNAGLQPAALNKSSAKTTQT